ncbi:MAG: hypothetical protein ACRDQI_11075 [Pseudonocardiaceae bacterium]
MASPIHQRLTAEGICAGLMAWVAWDWGSAAFNVVISFVFSPYLAGAVAVDETTGSAALGWATAAAGVIIAVIAPAWGQRSDATGGAGNRQRRLGALTAVVVLVTAALGLVRPHPSFLLLGLVLLAGGQVASQLAEVDHNALLRGVAPAGATGRVSGLGTAALHVGAIVVGPDRIVASWVGRRYLANTLLRAAKLSLTVRSGGTTNRCTRRPWQVCAENCQRWHPCNGSTHLPDGTRVAQVVGASSHLGRDTLD